MKRAFGKYRLASTRSERISGSVTTSWRSTLRKCEVPGICPMTATCGRDVAYRCRKTDSPTPAIRPDSMPSSQVTRMVATIAANSARE